MNVYQMDTNKGRKGISCLVIGFLVLLFSSTQSKAITQTANMESQKLCSEIFAFQGVAFFCYENIQFGEELHVSDGSQFGNRIVKDIDAGPGGSTPFAFFELQNKLFFIAETFTTGWALWKTDGTKNGTTFVKSLGTHSEFSQHSKFSGAGQIGNTLFFQIDNLLYKTDGSSSGTTRITAVANRDHTFSIHGSYLYFISQGDPILRRVNTSANVETIKTFDASSAKIFDEYVDGQIMIEIRAFTADPTDPVFSTIDEYWLSDGSQAGTILARQQDNLEILGVIAGKLLYLDKTAQTLISTFDWGTDVFIKSVDVTYSTNKTRIGNTLFFSNDDYEYYVTDGTAAGTVHTQIYYYGGVELGGNLIGRRLNDNNRLSKYNVANKITVDLHQYGSTEHTRDLTRGGDRIYYMVNDYNAEATSLWVTLGTSIGTYLAHSVGRYSTVKGIEGNNLYYSFYDSTARTYFLWLSNGTPEGNYILKYKYDDGVPAPEPLTPEQRIVAAIIPIIKLLIIDD